MPMMAPTIKIGKYSRIAVTSFLFFQTRAGRTTILIAHRISTIEKMDKILFIDDGFLAAVGTHEELYAGNAEYRKMVDLQRLEEEEGGNGNA